MSLWNRSKPEASSTPAPPPIPEIEELAQLIPERNQQERYLWERYVDRIIQRFDGLSAPEGGESLVRACLAAGCQAVPVVHRSSLWSRGLSLADHHSHVGVDLERRVRLGLFFAASLRHLVHTLCRLRIKAEKEDWHVLKDVLRTGEVYWHPLLGGGVSFGELQTACEGGIEITWLDVQPTDAQACVLASCFLQVHEISLLTPELAVDVVDYVLPHGSFGLFEHMLSNEGQIEAERVDVAALSLEALRQLSSSGRLRLNTKPGDLFVTPELSLLVAPAAVDVLTRVFRNRGHSFTRAEIYRALGDAGCLVGIAPGAKRHTCVARLKSPAWRAPIHLRGVPIVHGALWDAQAPPSYFDGTVRIEG